MTPASLTSTVADPISRCRRGERIAASAWFTLREV